MLVEHEPKRCHTPPELEHDEREVTEQLPPLQHEPLHGLGAHVVPPRNEPPAVAHAASVTSEQLVPLQHVPGGEAHGLGEQLDPVPSQSPPTESHADWVRSVHVEPTQQGRTWAWALSAGMLAAMAAARTKVIRRTKRDPCMKMLLAPVVYWRQLVSTYATEKAASASLHTLGRSRANAARTRQ